MQPVIPDLSPGAKYQQAAREFQGIPGVAVTPGGRLWATWYAGGKGEGPENYVLLVTSADGGERWSDPLLVVDPPANVRAFDPVVWIDPQGRLWFFWAQSRSHYDGVVGVWAIHTDAPESERPTWTAPHRLADGIMMNKPTVLQHGVWALPTALWPQADAPAQVPGRNRANLTVSEDGGDSFALRGGVDMAGRNIDEHMFVERGDGRLWMLVRTCYGVGQSFSTDGGQTWSPGEDAGISGPDSRFFIRRLASGRLLLVNHDVPKEGERKREKLTAWLSEDDGGTWLGGLLLDARDGVSYPDGDEDEAGAITIIYDHQRHTHGDILLARFRESDVLEGRFASAGAFRQRLVNRSGGVKGK